MPETKEAISLLQENLRHIERVEELRALWRLALEKEHEALKRYDRHEISIDVVNEIYRHQKLAWSSYQAALAQSASALRKKMPYLDSVDDS